MKTTSIYTLFFSPTGTSRKIAAAVAQGMAGTEGRATRASAGDNTAPEPPAGQTLEAGTAAAAPEPAAGNGGETKSMHGEPTVTAIDLTYPAGQPAPLPAGAVAIFAVPVYGGHVAPAALERLREIRGSKISVIFQDPMTSLNPVFTVSRQVSEPFIIHQGMTKKQAAAKVIEMLADVKIPNPHIVAKQYPHQLSGGMRQRVMIAMALACKPKLLIADEPTTALDVTIQAQILKLMNDLKEEHGTSIIYITHDLGVIRQIADDVAVMYWGQVVEMAPAGTIFMDAEFSHPYTEGLMNSIPRLSTPTHTRLDAIPGAVPHPLKLPKGCKFAPRCKYATERCLNEEPEMIHVSETQQVRCFYPRKEDRHGKK